MTIPIPYFVYGTTKDSNGDPVDVTVEAKGNSEASWASTTSSTGQYMLNIQDNASDGDTVTVKATYLGEEVSDSFTLTLGDLPKEINLQFTAGAVSGIIINHVAGKYVLVNKVQGKILRIG